MRAFSDWLTTFLMTLLPQPQQAAGIARGVLQGIGGAVGSAIGVYLMFDPPVREVLEYALYMGGFVGVARSWEGFRDAKRNLSGSVQPWDVGAFQQPIAKKED